MATKKQIIGLAEKLWKPAASKVRELSKGSAAFNFDYKYTDLPLEVRLGWEESAKFILKNYKLIKK